jgi:methionine synthase II (cobalamin-independent)
MSDHHEAIELVMSHASVIPLWIQLPTHREEGMVNQFAPGLPGLKIEKNKVYIDTDDTNFDNQLLEFYEDYIAVTGQEKDINDSRFVLTDDTAKGFHVFTDCLNSLSTPPEAVKGQITGPITFTTGLCDQNKKAIFYHEQLRDVAIKLLAMKAMWQVRQLSKYQCPIIIFFDEPALAGFGSSEFTSISHDDISNCFGEVIEAVHAEGGLTGVHVCANTDWSVLLESSADMISFDAYSFFDRLILYSDLVKKFIQAGKILAWGIVPTGNPEDIEKETTDSLVTQLEDKVKMIEALGIDRKKILDQSIITPSCGTGSLSLDLAKKVINLTAEVSHRLKAMYPI